MEIKVPDDLWLTAINVGGQTTTLDPPVLVHKGTKTLELTQSDGKPFTLQFRVWKPEPDADAHNMHTEPQNPSNETQPNKPKHQQNTPFQDQTQPSATPETD